MTFAHPDTDVLSTRRFIAVLAVFFVGIHAMLYAMGVRMDTTPLGMFMQFADPELLRTRLLETCWYLHVQPPLFNLFLGCILKAFPVPYAIAFNTVYLLMGFCLYVTIVFLQVQLGVARILATALATAFVASPTFILYEHLVDYTVPSAMLLAVSALLLDHFLLYRRTCAGWLFFAVLFVLGGIRATYHLAFYALIAVFVLRAVQFPRRRVLVMALIPALLLVSFYAKSYALFGEFSVCSYAGKHLWIKTIGNLPREDRVRLVEKGDLSQTSLIGCFETVSSYPERYQKTEGFDNVPSLHALTKSSGEINYNHLAQLVIGQAYRRDAVYGLLNFPGIFAATTLQAWLDYCTPGSAKLTDFANYPYLEELAQVYARVPYGQIDLPLGKDVPLLQHHVWGDHQYLGLLVGLPSLVGYGLWCALGLGRANHLLTRNQRVVILYLCLVILYVAVVGNIMEMNETSRFRFETDPFYLVLTGILIQHTMARFARTPLWLLPAHVEARHAATRGAEPA